MQKTIIAFLIIIFCLTLSCEKATQNHPDHVAWADTVVERADNLMSGPNPVSSLRYLDSAYNSPDKKGVGDLWKKYNAKANYYTHSERNLVMRRIYIDSMLNILKTSEALYGYEYAQSLFAMAGLLQQEKKYNQAFKVYYQGRSVALSNGDHCSMSEFSNALGIIRYRQEQYQQAIPFLKQAFQEIESCSSGTFSHRFILPQSIINTIALCFEKSEQPDSATYYYKRALKFISTNQKLHPHKQDFITTARAVVEGNLGGVYAKTGHFEEAERHLRTNINLNDRPGFGIEDAQTAKIKLAKLYISFGVFDRASNLLDSLEIDLSSGRGKSIAHADIWQKWYELKWLYHDKTGNIKEAYRFLNRFHVYRDSLNQVYNGLKTTDMDQVLREQDQKHQLSLLEKSGELKSLYVKGLSLFLMMTLLIALVIWLYYHRSRGHVKNLTALNHQMKQTLAALENSQLENTRLMKIVAHDLRNPVGAMVSLSNIMLMDPDRSEEDLECLKLIKDSGNNCLDLVGNLLHLNASTTVEFMKENVNLADIVQHCIDMLRIQAAQKQQHIRQKLQPAILPLNYEKMWRVISNLISNAIKFSPSETTINVAIETDGPMVKLMVKDEGIGIPDHFGQKIFDAFTDSKRKGTSGEESFGLGLSITKQIIEAHGGQITFESTEGKGTTFTILLPKSEAGKARPDVPPGN